MRRIYIRNRKVIFACIVLSLLAIATVEAFRWKAIDVEKDSVLFSEKAGFYDEDFYLTLSAPEGCDIYYTLNGEAPSKDGMKYEGPILIFDATNEPNRYSMREDVAFHNTKYKAPDYLIDKCVTVRAIYYCGSIRSAESRQSYFVGFQDKVGYKGISVMSLITEPDNLFGTEKGIYVFGEGYDTYVASDYHEVGTAPNFMGTGVKYEKDGYIEYFNEEKNYVGAWNVGIRIKGKTSRGFLPKSLYFICGGSESTSRFTHDFWDDGFYPHRISMFSGSNDYGTKMRDYLVSDLVSGYDVSVQRFRPCALFINGEYWGIYHLTDAFDEYKIANDYGVDVDNVIMVRNGAMQAGTDEEIRLYQEAMLFLETKDLSIDENYRQACELFDMDSMVDYFAIMIYIARHGDWPDTNMGAWRTRETGSGEYEDGRWRWILFDLNYAALEKSILDRNTIGITREIFPAFDHLCENEEFRRKFADRTMGLMNGDFATERVQEWVDRYIDRLKNPTIVHNNRFYGEDTVNCRFFKEDGDTFEEQCRNVADFFPGRERYVIRWMNNSFEMSQ